MKRFKFILLAAALLISAGMQAQVTIGADFQPNSGALLDIKESSNTTGAANSSKGLNLPRVTLQSAASLAPCAADDAASKASHTGLTVYNVATTNGLIPGFYYWNGSSWIKTVTEIPNTKADLNMLMLYGSASSTVGPASGLSGGIQFNFCKSSSPSYAPITIEEDGSYAFSLRLYGGIEATRTIDRCVYYLSLWKAESNGTITLDLANRRDIAEINIIASDQVPSGMRFYTYSVTLGGSFKKGDKVSFKLSHPAQSGTYAFTPWSLKGRLTSGNVDADCSTLIWWRL